MELADVMDSKSHSPVVTTSAETFDFSRFFDNSICKRFLMSLRDVPPISQKGHQDQT